MGLACARTNGLDSIPQAIPSATLAERITFEGICRYCAASKLGDGAAGADIDLSGVMVAFNGGKDCTVLLHLVESVLKRDFPHASGPLRLLYIRDPAEDTFPEIDEFIESITKSGDYNLIEIAGKNSMKEALGVVVSQYPEVRAIFMGTRSTDPNAGWMTSFCHTSPGWPEVDLIAPILSMRYSEVWQVIRSHHLPYCSLYGQGYTSIGKKSTTQPNPLLRVRDCPGREYPTQYLHADQLQDESGERLGRSSAVLSAAPVSALASKS